jgi:hypothetical protein
VLLILCWCFPLFFSVVPLFEPPETAVQYIFWTVIISGCYVFATYATYQVFLIECRWNGHEIRKFSWLFGWRFLLFRDLIALKEVEDGSVRLTSKWGQHLKFDRTWNGAPELIKHCRSHIAANTAIAPPAPAARPTSNLGESPVAQRSS